jgi:2-polyprenyl-3-methyl-5-hydroxy-6-metoxy-1,4-benzoquinol methylase
MAENIKYSLEQIQKYWTQQAGKHGQSASASWSDHCLIEMEILEILKYIKNHESVIDIGCANGYTTIQLASQKEIEIRGVDYIAEMIKHANLRLSEIKGNLLGTVSFKCDNILQLDESSGTYDKVIVKRVLINLHNWNDQLKGLQESIRVLKPGGLLLLSEATLQGWRNINKLRNEWGLSEIPMPPFNRYIDRDSLVDAVLNQLELIEIVNFGSTYYVGTRLLKPLLVQALGKDINVADPNMEWNRWFSQLPAWGNYGIQELFVFKKK